MGDWSQPLAELRWHYGSAYRITRPAPDRWLAQRRDTRKTLRAADPEVLWLLIREEQRVNPVPRWPRPRTRPAPRPATVTVLKHA